jgi:hypothetical protein
MAELLGKGERSSPDDLECWMSRIGARAQPPGRFLAQVFPVSLAFPSRARYLDLPRFRGHCSPWGEEGVHDAEDTTTVPTAASGATD